MPQQRRASGMNDSLMELVINQNQSISFLALLQWYIRMVTTITKHLQQVE